VSPRARTAPRAAAPVAFRGPPHRLSSLVDLPAAPETLGEPRALLEGAEIRGLGLRPLTREGRGVGKLMLRLPKSTPPGTYSGSVELGGRKHPVVVEVEPRAKVEASPPRLSFEAGPGAEVGAPVTLLNVGNVPFEVPAASTFCVFDGSGVDRAFWVAFTSEAPKGKGRIDLLLDELAESHGGLVEVRARTKNRTIAPGEAGNVQLTLRLSDRLRPGHSYAGSWDAEGLHVRVRVNVPSPTGRRR
jgi:hypothetical protein